MGAVHVRTPKNFVLEERLERYADAIETNPEAYAGDWRKACAPAGSEPFEHLHLDLGCGKGTYLVERAAHEPNTLFIGMDQEPICIAMSITLQIFLACVSERAPPNTVKSCAKT